MDESIDSVVGNLIEQLQDTNKDARKAQRARNPIDKEQLEDFVIQKSGMLVEDALDMIENVKDYITSAPESRDITSFAELINATTNTIETLNKLVISTKKNDTAIKIKEMDVDLKHNLQERQEEYQLKLTREQMFKMIMDSSKDTKELEVIESKTLDT